MDQLSPYITEILVLLIGAILSYFGLNVTQQQRQQTDTQKAGLTLAQQQAAVDFLHRVVPVAVRAAEQKFGMTPGQGALKERDVRDTVKALVGDTVDPLELTTLIQSAVLALPPVRGSQIGGAAVPVMTGATTPLEPTPSLTLNAPSLTVTPPSLAGDTPSPPATATPTPPGG